MSALSWRVERVRLSEVFQGSILRAQTGLRETMAAGRGISGNGYTYRFVKE